MFWNLQKEKKNEVRNMLFQITQISFNEPDCFTVDSVMNIMTAIDAKKMHKMQK